jgi:hypothetical protein
MKLTEQRSREFAEGLATGSGSARRRTLRFGRRLMVSLAVAGALVSVVACGGTQDIPERGRQLAPVGALHERVEPQKASEVAGAPNTGVFVNGYQLTWDDIFALENALRSPIPTGRYWLDGQGNYGYEGGPVLGNLYAGQTSGWESGGMQRNEFGDVGDGNFFDPETGCSFMPGGGVSC